jgi:hypothetical protein
MLTGCHLRWIKSHWEKALDPRPHGLSPEILIVFKVGGFWVGLGISSGGATLQKASDLRSVGFGVCCLIWCQVYGFWLNVGMPRLGFMFSYIQPGSINLKSNHWFQFGSWHAQRLRFHVWSRHGHFGQGLMVLCLRFSVVGLHFSELVDHCVIWVCTSCHCWTYSCRDISKDTWMPSFKEW